MSSDSSRSRSLSEVVQAQDVAFHPQSNSDRRGRLFEINGHIFRGIRESHAAFYENLLASPSFDKLFSLGLVETEKADLMLEGFPLVLKHRRISFVSNWREWPSLMLRDAAVMICDCNLELIGRGCGISDIHPWNVLFEFGSPVFVDFLAIQPLEQIRFKQLAERYRNSYILPLMFISLGHANFARSLRKSPDVAEPIDEFLKLPWLRWFPWWYYWLQRSASRHPIQFFEKLKARLERLPLPVGQSTVATSDGHADALSLDDWESYGIKARTVSRLLEQLKPQTLMDIGCGRGWYALLAERMGAQTIAIDEDEQGLNALYLRAKSQGLKILPLRLDFTVPTPRHGRKNEFPSSTERLTCEVALMLGLLDHLIFDLGLGFERIARLLSEYTRKYSIVEFRPSDDQQLAPRNMSGFDWYTQDNFIHAMMRYFEFSGVFESEPPRKILLFQKRA